MGKYSPAMEHELQEQLAAGVVKHSHILSGAPMHMARKESSASGYRFCIDFPETNKSVVAEPYHLPTIHTVLDSANRAKKIAKFDLRLGYWQFPVYPNDRHELAFRIQSRGFQYAVVAMGHFSCCDRSWKGYKHMICEGGKYKIGMPEGTCVISDKDTDEQRAHCSSASHTIFTL